jgi:hypothetical protein
VKAISLWQPWASLIACGAKPFETRHWAPPQGLIGQTIAIHAAKKVDRSAIALAEEVYYAHSLGDSDDCHEKLEEAILGTPDSMMAKFGPAVFPVGCIVCTARLDAAFQLGDAAEDTTRPAASVIRRMISRPMPHCFTVRYDDFGDYAWGRWAWLLTNVKPLVPPSPAVGRQGFFDLPQGWFCEVPA